MTQTPPTNPPFDTDSPRPEGSHLIPHRSQLLLSIACGGFVLCAPIGIFAWPMANSDLRKMDQGLMDASGRAATLWSKWIGMANVAQVILMCVLIPVTCVYFSSVLESIAGNLR